MQNVSATDKLLGRSTAGSGDVEEIACTAFARSILDDADEATFKATVNLEIGTDVQAYDADLAAIAALTATSDNFIQAKSSAWASRTPTQVTADLIAFVGDSGSGGTKGLVPAPTTGDAAKYLKGDGTWATVSGSGDFMADGSVPMTGALKENKGSDITAAATTDLGTATGNSPDVTHSSGTLAITSLGGASLQAGTEIATRFVITGGTLTLTHHATNLYLAGGANITLANGDVIRWRKMHSSNAEWKMVGGVKADGTAWVVAAVSAGKVKQIVYTASGAVASGTTQIPNDDTIPQNTEGTAWTALDTTITPTSASSLLVIELTVSTASNNTSGANVIAALFQDSTANALAASITRSTAVNAETTFNLRYVMVAGATSATTFKVRFGPDATGGTVTVNGVNTARRFGGAAVSTLSITEVTP